MSPKQKSDLVHFMKQADTSKHLLAVGDGANDVSMITKADVGVGISGMEGSQAVSASDYSISEFQQLSTLLLVHGRECYRRNSYLITYNFYKNLIYSMPLILVSLVSGWSSQTIYDIYMLQIYNLTFTCFPIMIFAVYDFEFSKTELLENPRLYRKGLQENYLSWSKYFGMFTESIAHGFVIFVLAYYLFDMALAASGHTSDIRSDGNMCYMAVVFAVTLKLLMDSYSINVFVVIGVILSVGSYFGIVAIMSLFPQLDIFAQMEEMVVFNQ